MSRSKVPDDMQRPPIVVKSNMVRSRARGGVKERARKERRMVMEAIRTGKPTNESIDYFMHPPQVKIWQQQEDPE